MHTTNTANGLTVMAYDIIGTNLRVYSVWEPYNGHSTSTTHQDARLGRVGTRPLPLTLEALQPHSDERYSRVSTHYAAEYGEAYAAIRTCYPHLHANIGSMGEITETRVSKTG